MRAGTIAGFTLKSLAIGHFRCQKVVLLCNGPGQVVYSHPMWALNTGDCSETFVETREQHHLHSANTGKCQANKEKYDIVIPKRFVKIYKLIKTCITLTLCF